MRRSAILLSFLQFLFIAFAAHAQSSTVVMVMRPEVWSKPTANAAAPGQELLESEFRIETSILSTDAYSDMEPVALVSPNPVIDDDRMTVEIGKDGHFTISLHDILGRQAAEPVSVDVDARTRVPVRVEGLARPDNPISGERAKPLSIIPLSTLQHFSRLL